VNVFNSVLSDCQERGGEDCEAQAFKRANGVVLKDNADKKGPGRGWHGPPKGTHGPQSGPTAGAVWESGEERDQRRAEGFYDVISETDEETAKILLTQGIEPSFKPNIGEVSQYAPGQGLEREGLYVANDEAFSRGSFGKVRLYLSTTADALKVPKEMTQLGHKGIDSPLKSENGAVTTGRLGPEIFARVAVSKSPGQWEHMSPTDFLSSVGISGSFPKLPSVPQYESHLRSVAKQLRIPEWKLDDIIFDYNRASLEDKQWLAEEIGII
jgi:hypothetical protein